MTTSQILVSTQYCGHLDTNMWEPTSDKTHWQRLPGKVRPCSHWLTSPHIIARWWSHAARQPVGAYERRGGRPRGEVHSPMLQPRICSSLYGVRRRPRTPPLYHIHATALPSRHRVPLSAIASVSCNRAESTIRNCMSR